MIEMFNKQQVTDFYLLETYLKSQEKGSNESKTRIERYLLAGRITVEEAEQLASIYLT